MFNFQKGLLCFFFLQVLSNAKYLTDEYHGIRRIPSDTSDWPCPLAADIAPCVCYPVEDVGGTVYTQDLNCSGVVDSQELWDIFNTAIITFPNFRKFTIKQDKETSTLTELPAGVFNDVTFQFVEITNTAIAQIEGGTFENSHSTLVELILSNNKLSNFPFEVLSLYTSLTKLSLNNNDIVGIPPITSNTIETLNLNFNIGLGPNISSNFDIFSGMKKIANIYLSGIGMKHLFPDIFNKNLTAMAVIDLSNNELTELVTDVIYCHTDSKGGMKNLYLENNNLKYIQNNAIRGMSSDGIIDISNNKLTQIDIAAWDNLFATAGYLDFAGNPLLCGCDVEWIVRNDTYRGKVLPVGRCYEGTKFKDLDTAAFDLHC